MNSGTSPQRRAFGTRFRVAIGALLALHASLTACGGESTAAPPPASGAVTLAIRGAPDDGVLLQGTALPLSAAVTDATGAPVRNATVTWQGDAPDVATVSPTGVVTARRAGGVTISASAGGSAASVALSVRQPLTLPSPSAADIALLSALDGALTFRIPPGAGPQGVAQLTVAPAVTAPADDRLLPNAVYDLGPAGLRFAAPITLGVRFDPARVPLADRGRLRVALIFPPNGVAEVEGSGVSPETDDVVSATITQLARYALMLRGVASRVAADSGNGQTGFTLAPLPRGIRVLVTDAAGRPVSRARVAFRVTAGGGRIQGDSIALTGNNGAAALPGSWVLGADPGAQALTAVALEGNSPSAVIAATAQQPPVPSLALAPSIVTFAARSAGTDPAPQLVAVTNGRPGTPALTGVRTGQVAYTGGASGWLTASVNDVTTAPYVITLRAALAALPPGSYTATVPVVSDLAGVTPATITVLATVAPSLADRLVVVTQPVGGALGAPLATQPVLEFRDANNRRVPGATMPVTATVRAGGGTLAGTTTVEAVDGVATFTSLRLDLPGTYVLAFSAPGVAEVASAPLVMESPVRGLRLTTAPAGAVSGVPLATQPVVRLVNADGATVTTGPGAVLPVTADIESGSGRLSGSLTVHAVNGVATFTTLTLSGSGAHSLRFSAPGGVSVVAPGLTVASGTATRLRVATQPAGAVSGRAFTTQPVVELTNESGTRVTGVGATVTARLASGTGRLVGTATVEAVDGVARFADLRIDGGGSFTLSFSAAGLTSAASSPFVVTQTSATLQLVTPAAGATSGTPFSVQPVVQLLDQTGAPVTTGSGVAAPVTLSVSAGATVVGNATVAAVNGVATFAGVGVAGAAGNYTLTYSSPGVPSVTQPIAVATGSGPGATGMVLTVGTSPTATAKVNTPLAIPIRVDLSGRGSDNLASIEVTVTWDPARFEYVRTDAGDWVDGTGGGATVQVNDTEAAAGQLRLVGFSTGATTRSFTLRTLTLRPVAAGSATVSAVVDLAGDEQAGTVNMTVRNLTVTISP